LFFSLWARIKWQFVYTGIVAVQIGYNILMSLCHTIISYRSFWICCEFGSFTPKLFLDT